MIQVFMKQVHGTDITVIENDTVLTKPRTEFKDCDGLITARKNIRLVAYGSDCVTLALWDKHTIGICHAGWRGLVNGMLEKMLYHFEKPAHAYIGPFLNKFEIRRDGCYEALYKKFKVKYFSESDGVIVFDFKKAVLDSLIDKTILNGDSRSTIDHDCLGSWRRDKRKGNGVHNKLTIWRDGEGKVHTEFFHPHEEIPE